MMLTFVDIPLGAACPLRTLLEPLRQANICQPGASILFDLMWRVGREPRRACAEVFSIYGIKRGGVLIARMEASAT
jgi:hypothetical protein